MKIKSISLIIPTFNEEANIFPLVKMIDSVMQRHLIDYELIFVDDHSMDNTVRTINLLADRFPIIVVEKAGRKGKAYSIIQGASHAKYDVLGFIDADLQYPPDSIPTMLHKIERGADVVVVNRKKYKSHPIRRVGSRIFNLVFGEMLFGLKFDIQTGLKIFTKEAFQTVNFPPSSGWSFDLEFLYRARFYGFKIKSIDITFEKRINGKSKISFFRNGWELARNSIRLKFKEVYPIHIPPKKTGMIGAGIRFNGKKYTVHSTLDHSQSALQTFKRRQVIFMINLILIFFIGFLTLPLLTIQVFIGALSFIYLLDVLFNLYINTRSLTNYKELPIAREELTAIDDAALPIYSILCPLYKEAHIIPQFIQAISLLDYPKEKLEVLLLLEADDTETIKAVRDMILPRYFRRIVVPSSNPRTKPKACNYGLHHAKGEYLVIFDAEDRPEPSQLKKAYLGFQKVDAQTICLQAKLNYYNPHQNILTRLFTAEYSLWFDITLTGLQSLQTSLPLGGTSNHFKTDVLKDLKGWDAFNVTEDADLGIRLFKKGYKTAIFDSLTLEEANSRLGNWLRQRSRWIKGYMQTYAVHTRSYFAKDEDANWHTLIFHLVIGGKIAFILINPILWVATASYFLLYAYVGPTIESFYPAVSFYTAAFSLVVGNFLFLYYYMIGLAKRNEWSLIKYALLVPFYWLMISIAGGIALFQLIVKPHYWEKTNHGLNSNQEINFVPQESPVNHFSSTPEVVIFDTKSKWFIFMNTMKKYMKSAGKNAHIILTTTLLGSLLFSLPGIIAFTLLSRYTVPFLFGQKAIAVLPYLMPLSVAVLCFTLARVYTDYYLAKKYYTFPVIALLLGIAQIILIMISHQSVLSFVYIMTAIWISFLVITLVLHAFSLQVKIFENNFVDFIGLFRMYDKPKVRKEHMRVLIFNWRDTRHKWTGGAEVYLHELAKNWVRKGDVVTIFCGNDGTNPRSEIIDGIQIYRHGGFYTVYVWAFLYYIFKFRGGYDIIIDSENGIPFFTPLYSGLPKFLLIHHVHQEVFIKSLQPPFSWLALFLEAKAMPFIYRNIQVITVSPSSKANILKHKLTNSEPIVIHNGVDVNKFRPAEKSSTPLILYLGRLQYYKSLHVFIQAAKKVLEHVPSAQFIIAGDGEERNKLEILAHTLGISEKMTFTGKVSEEKKIQLYQKAWVFVNPSLMEGWGITTIEANACGTPAVASNVPGLRDSIKNPSTGFLVPYGDVDLFAEHILKIVQDSALRDAFSKESITWSSQFSWEESALTLENILYKFCKRGQSMKTKNTKKIVSPM